MVKIQVFFLFTFMLIGGQVLWVNSVLSQENQKDSSVQQVVLDKRQDPKAPLDSVKSGAKEIQARGGVNSEGSTVQEEFSCENIKRVIINLSGKVRISTGQPGQCVKVVVEGKKEGLKVFQARNGQTVVVDSQTKEHLVCRVEVPPKLPVFISAGYLELDVDSFDGDLNVQAGFLICNGQLLGAMKAAAGKMNIKLSQLQQDCDLSCGEGDVQLSYDGLKEEDVMEKEGILSKAKTVVQKIRRKPVHIKLRQGKGVSRIQLPAGVYMDYRKSPEIESRIPQSDSANGLKSGTKAKNSGKGIKVKGSFYGPPGGNYKVILEPCETDDSEP